MAKKVIWSPEALRDLEEVGNYIDRDSPTYAASVIQKLVDAVEYLSDFPGMGRQVPELEDELIRELIVLKYRVIYRLQGPAVHIAAVIHGARELRNALRDRDLG